MTSTLKLWQSVALGNVNVRVRQREGGGAQHVVQGEAIAGAALAHDEGSQHDQALHLSRVTYILSAVVEDTDPIRLHKGLPSRLCRKKNLVVRCVYMFLFSW